MNQYAALLHFRIDPALSADNRRHLAELLSHVEGSEVSELSTPPMAEKFTVDFISENSLPTLTASTTFRICVLDKNQGLFSFGASVEESAVDAVVDDAVDPLQLEKLIAHHAERHLRSKQEALHLLGVKNLRRFESKAKAVGPGHFSSKLLLEFAQALVDLERDLIHCDDLPKIEKILRQFLKTHLEKTKLHLLWGAEVPAFSSGPNLLVLPSFRGTFVVCEFTWEDSDPFRLIQKHAFFATLINFFSTQQEIQDPFSDQNLWEGILDGIPFPVALLSEGGEVHQHNSLFAKLNVAPVDCLRYGLREKTIINDIPYNVFRKELHHLDEKKILFVFFTESFFLKGDASLTPSGQELGIISSSIAHELNNPIAGIQAAMSLLMLDDSLSTEARTILEEMKNGATRCKQLIETFLGFSRATPRISVIPAEKLSPVDLCYQQAQNLLRFRTVESGIRFSLDYSRHSDFRASVNLSLLTMTFYLVLGELMTLYSHHLLISDKNQVEKVIRGELVESSQEIQIQLHELNISTLSLSKLIQNLLTIENLVLQVSDYSLRFIYSPLEG